MMKTLLLFCACASLWAQGTVTIFGAVADSSGSVMPNVAVRAIRSGTGAIRQAISDARLRHHAIAGPGDLRDRRQEHPAWTGKCHRELRRVQVVSHLRESSASIPGGVLQLV